MKRLEGGINEEGDAGWDVLCNALEWITIIGFWGGLLLLFVIL